MFKFYFSLGIHHIIGLNSYDHIMFILALTAVYTLKEWKKIIILATAFTIGHSTTLALATLNIINIPSGIIEFLIAVTIFLTGFANLFKKKEEFNPRLHTIKYFIAMFFGLIHGLGFSNYLKYMLGMEKNIILPLFSFNIGIEIGQIIIIAIALIINLILRKNFNLKQRDWNLVLSGAAMGMATILMIERISAL